MLEPRRSRYLRALGIDSYVPRVILPGARPSAACEWELPATPESVASAAVAPVGAALQSVAAQLVAASQPATASQPTMESPQAERPVARSRPPEIDLELAPAARRTESAPSPVAAPAAGAVAGDVEAAPRIALGIAVADGILLVDDAPANPAERGEFQRLLGNVLFALRGAGAAPALDVFLWPMSKQPQLDHSALAARETLAAHIQNQIQRHAVHTVLLLGQAAQQWVELDAVDLRWVRTVSALGCLREPAQKRQLWQDIRHLVAVH
jgi:hypothetical protein